MRAKTPKQAATYAPIIGAEHCPACWIASGTTRGLRTESHHNGDRVSVAVCIYVRP